MAYTAIADRPAGFIPYRHAQGGIIRCGEYEIAGGYASDIFRGDPVKSAGTGRQINVAASGDMLLGVFAGCHYIDASGEVKFSRYWPASTSVLSGTTPVALVYDDPAIQFRVQVDGDFTETQVNLLTSIAYTAGDTSNGQSAVELDSSDIDTGDEIKILGLVDRPDNDYGTNAEVIAQISRHENAGALASV